MTILFSVIYMLLSMFNSIKIYLCATLDRSRYSWNGTRILVIAATWQDPDGRYWDQPDGWDGWHQPSQEDTPGHQGDTIHRTSPTDPTTPSLNGYNPEQWTGGDQWNQRPQQPSQERQWSDHETNDTTLNKPQLLDVSIQRSRQRPKRRSTQRRSRKRTVEPRPHIGNKPAMGPKHASSTVNPTMDTARAGTRLDIIVGPKGKPQPQSRDRNRSMATSCCHQQTTNSTHQHHDRTSNKLNELRELPRTDECEERSGDESLWGRCHRRSRQSYTQCAPALFAPIGRPSTGTRVPESNWAHWGMADHTAPPRPIVKVAPTAPAPMILRQDITAPHWGTPGAKGNPFFHGHPPPQQNPTTPMPTRTQDPKPQTTPAQPPTNLRPQPIRVKTPPGHQTQIGKAAPPHVQPARRPA